MPANKSTVATPSDLWLLSESILKLFTQTESLITELQACEAPARETLKRIGDLGDLADDISQRDDLFNWFARAFVNLEWDRGLTGTRCLSRHQEAFDASQELINSMRRHPQIGGPLRDKQASSTAWEKGLNEASWLACRAGLAFLYADEFPMDLMREAGVAVKLCEQLNPPHTSAKALPEVEQTGDFMPTETQSNILQALDGFALTKDKLTAQVCIGNSTKLYKKNKEGISPLGQLRDKGLVEHKHGLGYYRPDAPPPTIIRQLDMPGTK